MQPQTAHEAQYQGSWPWSIDPQPQMLPSSLSILVSQLIPR